MSNKLEYVDVIVPLSVNDTYQYAIEKSKKIQVGQRVVVQFGIKKQYTAIVVNVTNQKNKKFKIKNVISVLDKEPIITVKQIEFWKWISNYYLANIGDVMNAALPNSLKIASETKLSINNSYSSKLNDREEEIFNLISKKPNISIKQLKDNLTFKNYFSLLNQMISKGIINVHEYIGNKYSEKLISKVILKKVDDNLLSSLTEKQKKLFDFLNSNQDESVLVDLIHKSNMSRSIFKSLEKKKVIKIKKVSISRISNFSKKLIPTHELSFDQKVAFDKINENFEEKNVCLLHGVTSSGKTEIYIKLIEKELKAGKQVLYLLPEIALTIQIVRRLQNHFGDKVGVFHSNLNNSERVEVWNSIKNRFSILLGVRSSIFLPFTNLGLIIIDEEHDSSYKQQQPSPRYHARDSAIFLSSLHNSKVLLGSATPAIESYYNAKQGKFGFVELLKRYSDIKLPKIEPVDLKKGFLKKQMNGFFSKKLIDQISIQLKQKKQVILFQNKRGYSKVLSCDSCGQVVCCKYCSVSLTYHKSFNQLKCHYCGYVDTLDSSCKYCSSNSFTKKGFGTEQVVESLQKIFPDYNIVRMDHDTTRRKNAYEEIILDFQQQKIDILVGTQMIAKGFDFEKVSLVGIIDADMTLKGGDLRASEKTYQALYQVSGRAGRAQTKGRVIIQTYYPENETIQSLAQLDRDAFYENEIYYRKLNNLPPSGKMAAIIVSGNNIAKVREQCSIMFGSIPNISELEIYGPAPAPLSKLKGRHRQRFLIHDKKARNMQKIVNAWLKNSKSLSSVNISVDIDPFSFV